jgi:hypothetical protein
MQEIRVKPAYVRRMTKREKTPVAPVIVEESEPEVVFGSVENQGKRLDVDALLLQINKKGQQSLQRPIKELFFEVPQGCENGVMLTHQQVCRMFDITPATLHTWRKRFAMPVVVLNGGKKPPVRYDEGSMMEWGRLHGKKVMNTDYLQWY